MFFGAERSDGDSFVRHDHRGMKHKKRHKTRGF